MAALPPVDELARQRDALLARRREYEARLQRLSTAPEDIDVESFSSEPPALSLSASGKRPRAKKRARDDDEYEHVDGDGDVDDYDATDSEFPPPKKRNRDRKKRATAVEMSSPTLSNLRYSAPSSSTTSHFDHLNSSSSAPAFSGAPGVTSASHTPPSRRPRAKRTGSAIPPSPMAATVFPPSSTVPPVTSNQAESLPFSYISTYGSTSVASSPAMGPLSTAVSAPSSTHSLAQNLSSLQFRFEAFERTVLERFDQLQHSVEHCTRLLSEHSSNAHRHYAHASTQGHGRFGHHLQGPGDHGDHGGFKLDDHHEHGSYQDHYDPHMEHYY